MLDRQTAVLLQAADEIPAQPARTLARERRDDDLVDSLVVDRVHRGGVGVGMGDLAVRVDAGAAQQRERAAQAALGLGMRRTRGIALRADEEEARRRALGARADALEERVADHRLVRDHQYVRLLPPRFEV